MGNFLTDNDDHLYYLDKGIDWPAIYSRVEPDLARDKAYSGVEEAVETSSLPMRPET